MTYDKLEKKLETKSNAKNRVIRLNQLYIKSKSWAEFEFDRAAEGLAPKHKLFDGFRLYHMLVNNFGHNAAYFIANSCTDIASLSFSAFFAINVVGPVIIVVLGVLIDQFVNINHNCSLSASFYIYVLFGIFASVMATIYFIAYVLKDVQFIDISTAETPN